MRNYRYKVQTSRFGLFVGITAELIRTTAPPTSGAPVSERIWLDTSQVQDSFRGTPLTLNDNEVRWLQSGLLKVADTIELVEESGYLLVAVRALEIVTADYTEAALAPAVAGWAAAELGLEPPRVHPTFDEATRQCTFQWNN